MTLIIDERKVSELNVIEWRLAVAQMRDVFADFRSVELGDDRAIPEPISPERLRLAKADIPHLSPIIRQLVELWNGEEFDEYGTLRPNKQAFDRAVNLLVDAAIFLSWRGRQVPYGCASTDGEGGIRIEWVRPTRSVHLAIPTSTPDDGGYIYHEVGPIYATEPATPESLARWLREID